MRVVKFSRQNLCTNKERDGFLNMSYENVDNISSLCFEVVYASGYERDKYISDDISNYSKYMNI